MYGHSIIRHLIIIAFIAALAGCDRPKSVPQVIVYCSVDEPYASKVFADFEKETGIHVVPQYDIESSKSVGLAGKLEAEKANPHADVWWCSEAFLTARLASEDVLAKYDSPAASDIPAQFKDAEGRWAGIGLRARVLAVGRPPPDFKIDGLNDLIDPRLKGKIAMARPTAGSTGAHMAALYVVWGPEKTQEFCRKLHANGIVLLGGNAEVADQVSNGVYQVGLIDNDDVINARANGGKLDLVVPDQNEAGTLAMPTTVALVNGAHNVEPAKKLIDYLLSRQAEQKLIDLKFAGWSVRPDAPGHEHPRIKSIQLNYRAAAAIYARAQRESTAILEGREP